MPEKNGYETIQEIRYSAVTEKTITVYAAYGSVWMYLVTISITLLVLAIGVTYFKKESKYFAENI